MKKLVAVVAVLAMAAGLQAATITASDVTGVAEGTIVDIQVTVAEATPNTLQSFILSMQTEAGFVHGVDPKTATIWATSSLPVEPFFGDAGGNTVDAGNPAAVLAYVDYGMPAGTPAGNLPAVTDGLLAVLQINTAGLPEDGRTYAISFAGDTSPFGASALNAIGGADVTYVNGSFTMIPEPASLGLLALGALFLRRRVA